MSTADVAVANPPDLISGRAGEIVLNSNYRFSVGGAAGTYDLYSVALHEIGHSLGLLHGTAASPADAMCEDYVGPRTGLSAADVAAVRKLYGTREADTFEGTNGNGTTRTAAATTYLATTAQARAVLTGTGAAAVRGDITTAGDADLFRVTLPSAFSTPVVLLTVSPLSQLAARVSVLDANGGVRLTAVDCDRQVPDVRMNLYVAFARTPRIWITVAYPSARRTWKATGRPAPSVTRSDGVTDLSDQRATTKALASPWAVI